MNNKHRFAATINDLDNHLPKSRGDCFDYGSFNGCDGECPQLLRGECNGDISTILENLGEDDIDELYIKGFYQMEIDSVREYK